MPRSGFADPDQMESQGAVTDEPPDDPSPIDSVLNSITDPEQLSLIYGEAYRRHAEESQNCLTEEGFGSYVVEVWAIPEPEEFGSLHSSSGMADFGYGTSVSLRAQFDSLVNDGRAAGEDINAEFRSSLSEEEAAAFYRARDTCAFEAWEKYPVPDGYPQQIAEELIGLRQEVATQPEVVDTWLLWSRCMNERGYDYADRAQVSTDVEMRAAPMSSMLDEIAISTDPENHPTVSEFLDDLSALEIMERAVVNADLECAAVSAVDDVVAAELGEAEEAWVLANEDRLALLREETAQAWYKDWLAAEG